MGLGEAAGLGRSAAGEGLQGLSWGDLDGGVLAWTGEVFLGLVTVLDTCKEWRNVVKERG